MIKNKFIGQVKEYNRYGNIESGDFKMDLIDRKILYLLSLNARLSNTFIAKRLRIKRETVSYRIKRMNDEDFLHGTLALLDHRKLGFKNYLVYIKLKTVLNEKKLLNFLLNLEKVSRIKNCSGSYDIQIVLTVRKEDEFIDCFETIINKYHNNINSYDILEILEEDFLGLGIVLDNEDTKKLFLCEHKGSTFEKEFASTQIIENVSLDDKDKKILDILRLDGSISIKEVSDKIGIAQIAVKNRIKRLVANGIIKRFMPLASLNKLGYQWWKVFFKFRGLNKSKFLAFLKYHPNILWYMRLLGKWDYQFSIFAKDNAEFHKILDEIRVEFADNIISYDTIIVFNQFKYVQRVD